MRRGNIVDGDFGVPLDCTEREEIRRYVSQPRSIDRDHIHHTKAEPPSKFSFLSGIHPDLDKELSDIQSQQCHSSQIDKSYIASVANANHDTSFTVESKDIVDSPFLQDDEFDALEQSFQQSFQLARAKHDVVGSMSKSMSNKIQAHAMSDAKTYEKHSQNTYSVQSMTDTVSSKPKEISCLAEMDHSIMAESLPFSIDGMEKAKNKIRSQAQKIRDLEAKLENISIPNRAGEEETKDSTEALKKIMSPEERLQAHKQRKRQENKYKEKSGKWTEPPPLKRQSLQSNVKRKDDLTMRLTADPKERKQQDLVKKSVSRTLKKYERATSDDESSGKSKNRSNSIPSTSKKKKKKKRNRAKKEPPASNTTAEEKRDVLMKRLSMGVSERRKTKQSDDVPDILRRALKGHKIHKRTWVMSDVYDEGAIGGEDGKKGERHKHSNEMEANNSVEGDSYIHSESVDRCQTCKSSHDCEEDEDSPGVFYCLRCWEAYESGDDLSKYRSRDSSDLPAKYSQNVDKNIAQKNSPVQRDGIKYDHALWIVHDNPKLGSQLVSSGPKSMKCLVETREPGKKNCVRIMLGYIDYCGNIRGCSIGDASIEETDRGTECLRLRDVHGFIVNHDEVETRLTKDKSLSEFHLDSNKAVVLTGKDADASVKDFMVGCGSAVDVIIDPQCAPGAWYPQREVGSNSRKLAPQFRSKGVGYIRLGDDMGKNGLAFLSSDSCRTFCSASSMQANDINESMSWSRNSIASTQSKKKIKRSQSPRNQNQKSIGNEGCVKLSAQNGDCEYDSSDSKGSEDDDTTSVSSEDSDCSTDDDDNGLKENASELLKQLQNFEVSKVMKWNDKADLLIRLGKAIQKPSGRTAYDGSLTCIQDIIGAKNVNVHVLRSALQTVERIGNAVGKELSSHVAWRTIFIEILKLLKNKQVKGNAKEMLQKLHGECFTLGNSLSVISHVLGMGKSGTGKRKSLVGQNTPASNERQKANNVEIIEWLAEITEVERRMEEIDPIMDENGLSNLAFYFFSHESHRDVRCRKNALDGLLHTILYGVNKLGMDISNAQSLCKDLEESNPRAWSRLIKSVKAIYKEEKKSKRR